ncbi:hypothetical protein AK812_SmicGene34582 [Symbiodinium microadriaticum]|uniref:Uncharacterized protein n=1 Tax=Symbiodinium microadriaticum TaxID=2951 RepID=A0A1Q9CNM7_SYMMI|nr:hypothetical protein AK812_SmicGene34582 [Symbiodinium microadriaticum]
MEAACSVCDFMKAYSVRVTDFFRRMAAKSSYRRVRQSKDSLVLAALALAVLAVLGSSAAFSTPRADRQLGLSKSLALL